MGWSANIKCDREISEVDIGQIIESMPDFCKEIDNVYLGDGYGDRSHDSVLSFSDSWSRSGNDCTWFQLYMLQGLIARGYRIVGIEIPA